MSVRIGMLAVAGVVVASVAVPLAVLLSTDAPPAPTVVDAVSAMVLAISGAVAWRRRPGNRSGWLLVLTGAALALSNLVALEVTALHVAGQVVVLLFVPPLVAALLGFPTGRLHRHRWLLWWSVALATVLWWPVLAAHELLDDRRTGDALVVAHGVLVGLLGVYVAVVLVARQVRATPAARRLRMPVAVAGTLTALAVAVSSPFGYRVLDGVAPPWPVLAAWVLGFSALPLAMVVSLLRARGARLPLPDLLRAFADAPGGRRLQDAVAAALGDPGAKLVFHVPGDEGWRDLDGAPAEPGPDRVRTELGEGRARTAVLHDPVLLEEPELLETVAGAAALALDHERLRAEVRAKLAEACAVRARIVAASDETRRRIERDLHDGAQQTLVSLALALAMLQDELEGTDDGLAGRLVAHASSQADRALAELRELARGVFPALLVNDGLVPALAELAGRSEVGVDLHVDVPHRLPAPVEAAGWFLVREALANVARHAPGARATVAAALDGDVLRVEVSDDGPGGALLAAGATGDLAALADRVAALGGRLDVERPAGGGTRVAARLPARAPTPPGGPPPAHAPTAVPSG